MIRWLNSTSTSRASTYRVSCRYIRTGSVYPDRVGVRWWTKAWFNNREEGEASVEIEREQAIRFIHDNIEKDAWLEEFFPKQMEVYHNAIEQTKEQLLKQINMI